MKPAGYCPGDKNHTPCPSDYLAWHEWAEKKAETHEQVRCRSCGLYAVWVKRP